MKILLFTAIYSSSCHSECFCEKQKEMVEYLYLSFLYNEKKKLIKMTNKHCKTIPANLYAIFQVTISYIISHMMANRQKSKFFNSNYAIFYTAAVKFHLHLDLFKCGLTFWWLVQKLLVDISLCTSQKAIIFLQKTSNVVRGLKIYCMLVQKFGVDKIFFLNGYFLI